MSARQVVVISHHHHHHHHHLAAILVEKVGDSFQVQAKEVINQGCGGLIKARVGATDVPAQDGLANISGDLLDCGENIIQLTFSLADKLRWVIDIN